MYTFFIHFFVSLQDGWMCRTTGRTRRERERERASVDVDVDDGRVTALGFTDVPREGGVGGDDG